MICYQQFLKRKANGEEEQKILQKRGTFNDRSYPNDGTISRTDSRFSLFFISSLSYTTKLKSLTYCYSLVPGIIFLNPLNLDLLCEGGFHRIFIVSILVFTIVS